MNFEKITWETIVAYFAMAAIAVFALWKSLPPFLTWLDNRRKNNLEIVKINKSETAEFRKAELEHEFKLEELADKRIQKILEFQQQTIDGLKADLLVSDSKVKAFEEVEDKRKEIYLKKLFLLREYQRELKLLEADVLKLENADGFQKVALQSIDVLKNQMIEHEKLLS